MNTTVETPDGERHSVPISVSKLIVDLRQQVATLTKALAIAEAQDDTDSQEE